VKWLAVQISVVVAIIQMSYIFLGVNLDFILMFAFGRWNFEGRSGEGFFAIGDHAKVSRS
jgi:hypothetical protein